MGLNVDEHDDLITFQSSLDDAVFNTLLRLRKLLRQSHDNPTPSHDRKGVKLPKIDVPKFDGNLLKWRTFWEQFKVSIHERDNLSEAEKLVYLRHSLSEGSARHVIEGLSQTGECYQDAIECLCSRYNRPRIIHQTHVRMIMDAKPLTDGSGKELRQLHDTVQQHLRALKAMDYEPSGTFVTSILELKLDADTMFEWQRYSQKELDVPHYQELLEFLDLRAQASETSIAEPRRSNRSNPPKGGAGVKKPVTSYTVSVVNPSPNNCIVCHHDKHPLYLCTAFKALSHADKLSVFKSNNFCLNCLKSGHFVRDCSSIHRCRICQKPHHSLLHSESKPNSSSSTSPNPVQVHTASGLVKELLFMTCRLRVESPKGFSIEARGILDSASSASFVSERLTQTLRLKRSNCNAKISGIAGISHPSSTQSIASFIIAPIHSPNKKMNLSAIVVPHVTCDLPVVPIPLDPSWSHISNLRLADPANLAKLIFYLEWMCSLVCYARAGGVVPVTLLPRLKQNLVGCLLEAPSLLRS